MPDQFWVLAAIVLLIILLFVLLKPRKTLAGDMDAPMDLERHRAKSEAAMAAPVSEADAEAAAPLVAYVEEVRTGELPLVRPPRRVLVRRPLGARLAAEERLRRREAAWRAEQAASAAAWDADPLVAAVPDKHHGALPVEYLTAAVDLLAPALPTTYSSMPFPEPPREPEPWLLDGFTGEWEAGTFNARKVGTR